MTNVGSTEYLDRCAQCGADVAFLSTCIVCSTPVQAGAGAAADGRGRPRLALVDAAPRGAAGADGGARARIEEPKAPVVPMPPAPQRSTVRQIEDSFQARVLVARKARRKRRITWGLVALVLAGLLLWIVLSSSSSNPGPGSASTIATSPKVVSSEPSYGVPGASFTMSFPGKTVKASFLSKLNGIPFTATSYTNFASDGVYNVTVYPFPIGFPSMSATQFLRLWVGSVATTDEFGVPNSQPATYRGLPALEATLAAPGGVGYTRVFVILNGHVAYMVMVSAHDLSMPGYLPFLNSFRLAS
jgi:hypothetical protein